ncbi:UDP-N-acetylglucosamine acyltransferase [Haloechinothrix sp. LS1_15]|uniref:UDP-N-acetylglucosamine acyltransferase n=1 Tax=Haloechinothrix sp. LS1_15 TaxID=2652248 RepID=UPI00294777BE|nr:UDP-N-acetylglucosamine acyltransferase [Haloechinothrix sp. LS1_15]MDV6012367.1 UDP-N-acetylglucosamine acyltransferase [Haloechinothrix sp. LS1_15]
MSNRIHHTAVIGDGVELGEGNVIGPYAVLLGPAVIGDGNWIGPHVTIGTPASDDAAPHPAGWEPGAGRGDPERVGYGVAIGNGNGIREYSSMHQGTWRTTRLGDRGYLLRGVHLAHDCLVGDRVVLGSNAVLGGHGEVWSHANLGLGVVVHQRRRIGPGAMVGMGAAVRSDVPAFTVSVGVPARVTGVNRTGLARLGVEQEAIAALEPFLLGQRDDEPAAFPDDGVLGEGLTDLLASWHARQERSG